MKTLLTAAALAFAIPAGAALADTHCDVPTANMQSWESLIQLTKDFGWSISKMELDDGCYELNLRDGPSAVIWSRTAAPSTVSSSISRMRMVVPLTARFRIARRN